MQDKAFKINVSFGYVFEKQIDTHRFTYSIGSARDDRSILDEPVSIGNHRDFEKLKEKISLQDEESFHRSNFVRDTKTRVIGIYQLFVQIYQTSSPIGAGVILPPIILNSKYVYPALNGYSKEDNNVFLAMSTQTLQPRYKN